MAEEFNKADGITLKEYFEKRLDEMDRRNELIRDMNQIAVDKAVITIDKRLTGMNEFRNALKDQQNLFVSKEMYEALRDRVSDIELKAAEIKGKASQKEVTIALISSIIGITLGLITLFTKLVGG